jgi:hypothetical protein
LNRLFHQYFGFSLAALRMEMRLLKAMALLRDPDAKVINVAEKCGFNHLGLFNTCFKRRFGVTPGQWRNGSLAPVSPSRCPKRLRFATFASWASAQWSNTPSENNRQTIAKSAISHLLRRQAHSRDKQNLCLVL